MNRATQAPYSPGSTFKPLQALVFQQMGGINEHTMYACNGPASSPIKCTHHHGSPVGLLSAIEQSCNPYFWQAFKNTLEKDGYGENNILFRTNYDEWVDMIKSFGLGERYTDADIYEQTRGYVPTQKYYNKVYRAETGWRALTIRSNSIGQGEILSTPLQLANTMAVIANKGYYITPHIQKHDSMLTKIHHSKVDSKYFPIVIEGMSMVFESGTARASRIEGINMCGKTGTVQNNKGKDHSIFVGFAPRENPKIAMAIVVENAGFGSTYAAPIFSLLVEQYLQGAVERVELKQRVTNTVTNTNVKER
jgi:penicillin-binding protein 2